MPSVWKCMCGYESTNRNPVAARWAWEYHILRGECKAYNFAAQIGREKGEEKMPKENNTPDDPFKDDWGPEGGDAAASDEMPTPVSDPTRAPFLNPADVRDMQGTLDLIGVAEDAGTYSDVAILVKYNAKIYRIGFKLFADSYKRLQKKFGTKKADWHGKLLYRVKPHKGRARGFFDVKPA